ncbi:MAG: YhjD/YihY/BrkB family envelope integrity protein [Spirochaetota bacterium]|nr:YhjD/YihY/BrkB family envelope integrity protein [Spirochaetota bacterium]
MSKNSLKISEIKNLKNKISTLLNDIYLGEKTYSKINNKIINGTKVFIVSSKKFILDDCFTKASSIAYMTIISLIPTLTVVLTFYSIFSGVGDKKEELFRRITLFMIEHNIKLNIDPFIEVILSLIENAGKIGGIGAIVMVFSATGVLRTFEKSLDGIWRVKHGRPFILKIIYYWATLTLGPLILISGTTVAARISATFSSPNYNSAYIAKDNKIWVVGNKSNILYSENLNMNFLPLPHDRIDFYNQRIFKFDIGRKTFKKEDEFMFEPRELKKSGFTDIQFIGDYGWIIGDNGIILHTKDMGKSWSFNKFGAFDFNDICMIDQKTGFIAADDGYLLTTKNGGRGWKVIEWKELTSNLKSISFYKSHGIIAGDRGIVLKTIDAGKTWNFIQLDEIIRKNRPISLNYTYHINEDEVLLIGDEGTILYGNTNTKEWNNRKFLNIGYYSALFINSSTGYIAGEKGDLIYTENAGQKWHIINQLPSKINKILHNNNNLWVIGDTGLIMRSSDNGGSWKGMEGKHFGVFLLNFFAPFAFIWLLFLLTYLVIPNTRVQFKPASIGAAFTSTVWVIFILLFIVYIKSLAKGTVAIYGALAAFPLFLLLVYASSLIVLFGAEVSYTLMHPQSYMDTRKALKGKNEINVYYGISILYQIYKKFEEGRGATSYKDLLKITSNQYSELDSFIVLFKEEKIILESGEESFIPANSSSNIILADVITKIHDISFDIPNQSASNPLKNYLHNLFISFKKSREEIVGGKSLNDIIKEIG